MALGTFTPPASGTAGSFDPRYNVDKPLIVVVREFREGFTTRRFPNPKDVVIVDIVDVMADTVHLSVIWGSAAIADRLKGSAPAAGQTPERLPVKIEAVMSAAGNSYTTIVPLDGKALELAAAWDAKNPTRIDDERAAKEAADRQNGAPQNGNGSSQNGTPQAPIQGLGNGQGQSQQASEPSPDEAPAPSAGMDEAALQAAIDSLR